MKNLIKYYYGLDITYIRQKDNVYYFKIDGYDFIFYPVDNSFINIYEYIRNNNYFHTVFNTLQGGITVMYNNENYVLMRINIGDRDITLNDIVNEIELNSWFDKKNWVVLWSNNIDIIENELKIIDKKYPYLSMVSNYYIGLAENALQFINEVNINCKNYLTHKRIKSMSLINFLNPANLILDNRVRDISDYFKNKFFSGENIDEIYRVINFLSNDEKILFFARMLYPTYFFDIYTNIILDGNEEKLKNVAEKSLDYEKFLKSLYEEIKKTTYIPNIDWL